MLKIGVIVGREWSWPPAFIEEVTKRDEDIVAEYAQLGGTRMDEPCPYAVLIDRISHEVPYYRSYLKNAMLQGTYVINNPFMWTADDKFFGAYHAMNFALRHPDITNRVIAMSGLYDIERWAGDYRDDNLYYNSPCLYIPNESDEGRLKLLRQLDIIMAIGREDSNIENNRWLSGALWGKGIGNALREWDGWAHDWPWWLRMIQLYIGGHD